MYIPKYQEEYEKEYDREYARLKARQEKESEDKKIKTEKSRRQALIQSIFLGVCLLVGYLLLKGFIKI